jgi:hypothetical protein
VVLKIRLEHGRRIGKNPSTLTDVEIALHPPPFARPPQLPYRKRKRGKVAIRDVLAVGGRGESWVLGVRQFPR